MVPVKGIVGAKWERGPKGAGGRGAGVLIGADVEEQMLKSPSAPNSPAFPVSPAALYVRLRQSQ